MSMARACYHYAISTERSQIQRELSASRICDFVGTQKAASQGSIHSLFTPPPFHETEKTQLKAAMNLSRPFSCFFNVSFVVLTHHSRSILQDREDPIEGGADIESPLLLLLRRLRLRSSLSHLSSRPRRTN